MSDQINKTSGLGIHEAGKISASSVIDELEANQLQPIKVDYPTGRKLSCGCTVYNKFDVMSASLGSSCPNCYDRMSDC